MATRKSLSDFFDVGRFYRSLRLNSRRAPKYDLEINHDKKSYCSNIIKKRGLVARTKYIDAYFELIDWDAVNARLAKGR